MIISNTRKSFSLIIILLQCLYGCGTTTDRQTKTVEMITTQTDQIIIDIPLVGQAIIHPTKVVVSREQSEVEQERRSIDVPNLAPILQASVSGTPIGAILGTIFGFGGVAAGLHQMFKAKNVSRQRDEIIDSFELVTDEMTNEQWEAAKPKIKQSKDTKSAVNARIG